MLHGYKPRRPCVTMSSSDTAVAFGRTTQTPKCLKPFVTPQNLDEDDIGVTKMSVPIRRTMLQNTQFTDGSEPVVATSTVPRHRKPRLSGQESKHIGRQMFASSGTEDLAKAKEYWEKAHEIFSGKLGPNHPNTKLVKGQLDALKE